VTRYISLAEFWFLAEQVTGIDSRTLIRASRVDLADSATTPEATESDALEEFFGSGDSGDPMWATRDIHEVRARRSIESR
jgi:hypothetical protein